MAALAWLEVRRDLRRFAPLIAMLSVLCALAVAVASLADGLLRASTGSLRSTDADLYVFADGADRNVFRSVLPEALIIPINFFDGVAGAGPIGFAPASVRPAPLDDDTRSSPVPVVAVSVSHGLPGRPANVVAGRLPFDGEPRAIAVDARLLTGGIDLGDRVVVADLVEAEVVGVVDDAGYLLRPTVWLPPPSFATVRNAALPEFDVDESLTSVLAVRLAPGADPAEVAARIDRELEETDTVTARTAYRAIPGVAAQRSTLQVVLVSVLLIAAIVVALFLALAVLDRRRTYAVLVALGVHPRRIAGILVVQAAMCAATGAVFGTILVAGLLVASPLDLPVALRTPTLAGVAAAAICMASLGAASQSRSLARLDPATELTRDA